MQDEGKPAIDPGKDSAEKAEPGVVLDYGTGRPNEGPAWPISATSAIGGFLLGAVPCGWFGVMTVGAIVHSDVVMAILLTLILAAVLILAVRNAVTQIRMARRHAADWFDLGLYTGAAVVLLIEVAGLVVFLISTGRH